MLAIKSGVVCSLIGDLVIMRMAFFLEFGNPINVTFRSATYNVSTVQKVWVNKGKIEGSKRFSGK